MEFTIAIKQKRPSGHEVNIYRASFGCPKSTQHLRDIKEFLQQLETECPEKMKKKEPFSLANLVKDKAADKNPTD